MCRYTGYYATQFPCDLDTISGTITVSNDEGEGNRFVARQSVMAATSAPSGTWTGPGVDNPDRPTLFIIAAPPYTKIQVICNSDRPNVMIIMLHDAIVWFRKLLHVPFIIRQVMVSGVGIVRNLSANAVYTTSSSPNSFIALNFPPGVQPTDQCTWTQLL